MDRLLCQLLYFVINFSNLLGQVPYKWNSETRKLTASNSIQWKLTQVFLPFHLVYVYSRFFSSMFDESLLIVITGALYTLCFSIHYLIHVTYIIFFSKFFYNFNKYLTFLEEAESKSFYTLIWWNDGWI